MNLQELNNNIGLHERLDRAYEMLESLEDKAGLQGMTMDGMPHGTDVSDKVGNIAIAIVDLKARIRAIEDELETTDEKVRAFANSFEDERLQQIIQLRFISGFTWGQVADLLGTNFTENGIKRLVYTALIE